MWLRQDEGKSFGAAMGPQGLTCEAASIVFRTVLTEAEAFKAHQTASKARTNIAVDLKGCSMTWDKEKEIIDL